LKQEISKLTAEKEEKERDGMSKADEIDKVRT
jgi:hypothetical protein